MVNGSDPLNNQWDSAPSSRTGPTPMAVPRFGQTDLFDSGDQGLLDRDDPEESIAHHIFHDYLHKVGSHDDLKEAEEITSKIIKPRSQSRDGIGRNDQMAKTAWSYIHKHGVGNEFSTSDKSTYEAVLDFPLIHALALISYYSGVPGIFNLRDTYLTGVRALNTLAILIDKLRDYDSKRVYLEIKESLIKALIPLLQKIWTFGIWLLGTVRTRARLLAGNNDSLDEANVIHATHYREEVKMALLQNQGIGKVCNRALFILTRESTPPFVQPLQLIYRLNELDLETFHKDCTQDECKRDSDGKDPPRYHMPNCVGNCGWRVPPSNSQPLFNEILEGQKKMPAVNLNGTDWWTPTTKNTLAISHVWRDGIYGTRDNPGLPNCLHKYIASLAETRSLESYWIDCATIPEDTAQRNLMIKMINSTFRESNFTLCCDNRVAKVPDFKNDGTALLVIITSFWHRRAWTLLEGHKAKDIRFLREGDLNNPFKVEQAILNVLRDESGSGAAPLWLLSSISELEAYMVDGLTPEASGILLSSRNASRPDDSELIWRLLVQPFTTINVDTVLNDTPFDYNTVVDAAFISSNAMRSDKEGFCWMPAKTNANEWISYSIGAKPVKKIQVTTTHLEGEWFYKDAANHLDLINWNSQIVNESVNIFHLREKLESKAFQGILVCPIWRVGPKKGEWDRAIIMTRPELVEYRGILDIEQVDLMWHWETIIELKAKIKFTSADIATLKVGFENTKEPISSIPRHLLAFYSASQFTKDDGCRSRPELHSTPSGNDTLIKFVRSFAYLAAFSFILQNLSSAMASSTNTTTSPGTLEIYTWIDLPYIPLLLDEWVSIIPLAVYLSSSRSDFELAGEVTLRGKLSVSIIPKLWALSGIAKMLKQGDVFFDTASSGGVPLKVYDVQWGSVFPCYNSAAALAVEENVFRHRKATIDITRECLNNWITENQDELLNRFTLYNMDDKKLGNTSEVFCGGDVDGLVQRKRLFGRRQRLSVIVVSSIGVRPTRRQKLQNLLGSGYWQVVELSFSLAVAGFLLSCGLIGSGSLLVIGGLSRFCANSIKFNRSSLYLRNREVHEGCMLTSLHENATSWTLYVGHRGLIDSLLNKPMVEPGQVNALLLFYFQFAEALQVLGMTYVAGAKGWDGIVFMLLILMVSVLRSVSGNDKHAARWLEEEGFQVAGFNCEFPGRTELLGAVQLLSTEKKTYWMDGILAPVRRREVWLKKIGALESDSQETERECASLNEHDRHWVNATGMQTIAGYKLIQERLKNMVGYQEIDGLARLNG